MIRLTCPHCSSVLHLATALAGQIVTCPDCGHSSRVPSRGTRTATTLDSSGRLLAADGNRQQPARPATSPPLQATQRVEKPLTVLAGDPAKVEPAGRTRKGGGSARTVTNALQLVVLVLLLILITGVGLVLLNAVMSSLVSRTDQGTSWDLLKIRPDIPHLDCVEPLFSEKHSFQSPATVWIQITYVTAEGEETAPSLPTCKQVQPGHILTVSSLTTVYWHVAGWYVYAGTGEQQPPRTAMYRQGGAIPLYSTFRLTQLPTFSGPNPPARVPAAP